MGKIVLNQERLKKLFRIYERFDEALKLYRGQDLNSWLNRLCTAVCRYKSPAIAFYVYRRYKGDLPKEGRDRLAGMVLSNPRVIDNLYEFFESGQDHEPQK